MPKIHITGGAGFIGSNLVAYLNKVGVVPYVYDTLGDEKWKNLSGLSFMLRDGMCLFNDFPSDDVLVHLGANVDTTEKFNEKLWYNNFTFSLQIFKRFKKVIYASSGATYGAEESNFKERIYGLKQLNAYGFSKWALDEAVFGNSPAVRIPQIYGLRFFNVYGPNETHKGEMQSVVSRVINKLPPLYLGKDYHPDKLGFRDTYSLFASDRKDIKNGEQKRDFVFVNDVCNVIGFFLLQYRSEAESGIYNLGSGKARTFIDLVKAADPDASIKFVPTPDALKKSYQYFTEADLTKLRNVGYRKEFTSLEEGVRQTIALTNPKQSG